MKYLGGITRPDDIITLHFLQEQLATLAASTYATEVGDGLATSFVLTHGLETTDVSVTIYEASGNRAEVDVDVEHTDANSITLKFQVAPSAAKYRVLVVRQGAVPGIGAVNFIQGPAGPAGVDVAYTAPFARVAVLGATDPVPANLPPGTVILRPQP